MQISWGTKLTIVFVVFAASISYMVYQCFNTPVNLVSDEYYKDEIAYQQIIDGSKNAVSLSSPIMLRQKNSEIIIQLPAEMKSKPVSGSVLFYCASNSDKDRKFSLQVGQNAQQVINPGKVMPGSYIVKTEWWANKIHYYNEQLITVL